MEPIENLIRALCRAFGAFWMVCGVVHLIIAPLLFVAGTFMGQAWISASAAQIGAFAVPSFFVGLVMIRLSGRIARMAVAIARPSEVF